MVCAWWCGWRSPQKRDDDASEPRQNSTCMDTHLPKRRLAGRLYERMLRPCFSEDIVTYQRTHNGTVTYTFHRQMLCFGSQSVLVFSLVGSTVVFPQTPPVGPPLARGNLEACSGPHVVSCINIIVECISLSNPLHVCVNRCKRLPSSKALNIILRQGITSALPLFA